MTVAPNRLLAIALVQQGALVLVQGQTGEYELPTCFIGPNEAFDLPLLIEARRRFGWRAVVGGILGKDTLPSGLQRIVASAFFDADGKSLGEVPEIAILRCVPSDIAKTVHDSRLAALAQLACS